MDDSELIEGKQLASFERYGEFVSAQSALLAVDLSSEPSRQDNGAEAELMRKLTMILGEYQEQSYLLDPYLENLVVPAVECLRAHARTRTSDPSAKSSIARLGRLAELLYNYIKLRGYKTITSFFPHEIVDVTIAIEFMRLPDGPSVESSQWTLRYVVLLWLSLVCRIPFDLDQFDEDHQIGRLASALESTAMEYLNKAGLEREGAAILLSQFYMRKDTKQRFETFLQWSMSVIKSNDVIQSLGVLQVLCEFLHRALMEMSETISNSETLTVNTLVRKYRTKLLSRVGLRLVPPRPKLSGIRMRTLNDGSNQDTSEHNGDDDDEIDVPEELEVILDVLFKAVQDRAKGIGRLSERLSNDFARQVMENILHLFSVHTIAGATVYDMPSIAEATWHAEMARRALVPSTLLPNLLDWLSQALYFDIRKGAHSVGSNVRDAAAYVIWALARSQVRSSFSSHAPKLAEKLVAVSLFDRDVSIRRAASAAFQEHVGRMGLFAHGIDVLRKTDFYSVSIRRNAFLTAAPQVAEHEEYRPALVEHLISITLRHWDVVMRQLAAKSLRLICEINLDKLSPPCIQRLARLLTSVDVATIHGAVAALTEIADAYNQFGYIGDRTRQEIFILINCIPESLVLAPRNEQILSAVCSLVAVTITREEVELEDRSSVSNWKKFVDRGLRHQSSDVREAGAASMATVSSLTDCSSAVQRYVTPIHARLPPRPDVGSLYTYIREFKHGLPPLQQSLGYLLGVLDYHAHPHGLPEVVECLLDNVSMESATRMTNVEARRNSFLASSENHCLCSPEFGRTLASCPDTVRALVDVLDNGLDDYTTDERGDVGSWIRIACIQGLTSIIETLFVVSKNLSNFASMLPADRYHHVVGRLLRQGVERLDNVRHIAGECFTRLLSLSATIGEGPGPGIILAVCRDCRENGTNWNNGEWLFPKAPVLTGLVLSVSTRTNSTQRPASSSLAAYVRTLPVSSDRGEFSQASLAGDLIEYALKHITSNNVVVPVLQTFNMLLEADALTCSMKNLISIATKNVSRLKNVQRIQESMKIVVNIFTFPSVAKTCLSKIADFLVHPYPRVRSGTAEHLYLVFEELLLETGWSSTDVERVKEAAQALVKELASNMEGI
ncbi:TBCD protein [Pisolithus orientalis]|uniref:TBCD protein n=1 Tax=Pisolithus orientalis TaxID=936130 RepID=UPI0022256FB5|nr:TBCD protein [Pisolithus orientalis]KAI6030933.1 TBCD protein [Pisolithus orientalis]